MSGASSLPRHHAAATASDNVLPKSKKPPPPPRNNNNDTDALVPQHPPAKFQRLDNGEKRPVTASSSSSSSDSTTCTADFDLHFGLLGVFQREHGHCRVPKKCVTGGESLGQWVVNQRKEYNKFQKGEPSNITPGSIDRLNSIGFAWDAKEAKYDAMIELVANFKKKHGHCRVPQHYATADNTKLGRWVDTQRRQYRLLGQEGKRSEMTPARIERLEAIGFDWGTKKEDKGKRWNMHVGLILEFKKLHGNCLIPQRYVTDNGIKLGATPNEAAASAADDGWDHHLQKVRQCHSELGHCCHVTGSAAGRVNLELESWADEQRLQYRRFLDGKATTMTLDRIEQLDSLGFDWSGGMDQSSETSTAEV